MKKLFSIIISLIFIVTTTLFGQSRFSYGFQASYVLNGLFYSDPFEYNELKTNMVLPGPSFTIGTKHRYYLNKKRTFSTGIGMLYEHSGFTKFKVEKINDNGKFKRKEQFRKQYILVPMDIQYHYKKFGVSVGLIYTNLLSIKMKLKYCYTEGARCNYQISNQEHFKINEKIDRSMLGVFSLPSFSDIDERDNLQYSFGLHYQFNERIDFGLQYRDFIFDNFFWVFRTSIDLGTTIKYHHQTNAIDFSIRYLIH